jgi:UDP-N-acetylglucosamine acyltransferase
MIANTNIHPTAVVDPKAKIGKDVEIGPFCLVGPDCILGDRVQLKSHIVVTGLTSIGADTVVFPFAVIGHQTQDKKYRGEKTKLVIGERNMIREHVTMHPATFAGEDETRIGNNCLFMVGSHVAHDCLVEDNVILANNATLGGHVVVEEFAIIGGLAAIQQFVRIGKHAIVGGMSGVELDVIPYGSVKGDRARLNGLNLVGLKRRGFGRHDIQNLRSAYRLLFADEGTMQERLDDVTEMFSSIEAVADIVKFIKADSPKTICPPRLDIA